MIVEYFDQLTGAAHLKTGWNIVFSLWNKKMFLLFNFGDENKGQILVGSQIFQ